MSQESTVISSEETTLNEIPSDMKKKVHRRMISLPILDNILAKSKQLLSNSLPEISPIPENTMEESNNVTLISSSLLPMDIQRSHSFSPDSAETLNEKSFINPTTVDYSSDNESSTPNAVIVTSPSFNSDLTSEQNDSIDQLNPSSLTFLQTKQRRIDHRRNKSEPVKSISTEDLTSTAILELSSNSTTSNESSLTNNATNEPRKKSSTKTNSNHISPTIASKTITPDKISSLSTTTARKKKPWYNPFQSTYRQRYEEFRKLFKDIPDNERLIVDYSCAWQKDILAQGRMYLSQNYLCFYANILNWKSSLCLKFQDIVAITREKTAKVISNAIEIKSNKNEKYFFASFVTRDKTYAIIHRLWQATRNDQPLSNQQLWTMIHESYGDDLDMTTDDEDIYHRSSLNSPSDKTSTKSQMTSNDKYDRMTPNSVSSKSFPQEDDGSSISSRDEHQSDDEGIIPIGEESTTNTLMRRPQSHFIEQDTKIISENGRVNYLIQCPCQSHLATELINRTYSMSVEHLFDCIFGDNDFLVAYRASRRIKDYQAGGWQVNDEIGQRERLLTYKVTVSAVFGSTTICSNEKQVIISELSKSHYIVDTEVRNEGIKYADSFYVASRYCLVQTGAHKSHLKVTCEVRYVKSLMAIIKMKRMEQESSKRSRSFSTSNNSETEKVSQSPPVSVRRLSRQQQANELTSSKTDLSIHSQDDELIQDQISTNLVLSDQIISSRNTFLIPFCLITMLLLLIVNIFLCIKLNQIDRMTDRLVQNYPSWLDRYSYQHEDNEWTSLLRKQEEYYQMQLNSLHSVLMTTHNALRNVTDALHQLSKLGSGSR